MGPGTVRSEPTQRLTSTSRGPMVPAAPVCPARAALAAVAEASRQTKWVEKSHALSVLQSEVSRILSILDDATVDLRSPVPVCPGWLLEDVPIHLGRVYSLVATIVSGDPSLPPDRERLPQRRPDESAAVWMKRQFEVLLALLSDAPPDGLAWNFVEGPCAPASFWWRRQVHETTIHRVDVELAAGLEVSETESEIAADGIEDFLVISGYREGAWDDLALGEAMTVHLHPNDVDEAELTVDSGAKRYARAHMKADVAVNGPAWEIDLWCWGRSERAGASIFGDAEALRAWRPRL